MTQDRVAPRAARTVFLGSGGFGVPTLRMLAGDDTIDLVAVVTAPARPAGRRQLLTSTPVELAARDLALEPILTPGRLRDPASIDAVLATRPELVVLADYGQIVPAALLSVPSGALNLHPSLLPRHRGASPIPAAILAGDAQTGITLMRMDEGLDTGPIVAQMPRTLDGTETSSTLEDELAGVAADLLRAHLGPWLRGELVARPQPADGATLTRPLRREDGRLDPTRTAVELERAVRAYTPWPGTFIDTPAGRIVVRSATAESAGVDEQVVPGTILEQGIATGDGVLAPAEVQPAGGRPMTWAALLRGRPTLHGEIAGRSPG